MICQYKRSVGSKSNLFQSIFVLIRYIWKYDWECFIIPKSYFSSVTSSEFKNNGLITVTQTKDKSFNSKNHCKIRHESSETEQDYITKSITEQKGSEKLDPI